MSLRRTIWDQIKNISVKELMSALERDGWVNDLARGATQAYINPSDGRRVVIHYHPGKTYGGQEKLLKGLLKDIGWTDDDFIRLKLAKTG